MTEPLTGVDLLLLTREEGAFTVVAPAGEIDAATVNQLRTHLLALIETGKTQLVLDLTNVSFIDSTGLGVLVAAHKRARAAGGYIRIAMAKPIVLQLFKLTALDMLFQVHPSGSGTRRRIAAQPAAT